jgi:hypothetical protein
MLLMSSIGFLAFSGRASRSFVLAVSKTNDETSIAIAQNGGWPFIKASPSLSSQHRYHPHLQIRAIASYDMTLLTFPLQPDVRTAIQPIFTEDFSSFSELTAF